MECKAALKENDKHFSGLMAYATEFNVKRVVLVNLAKPARKVVHDNVSVISIPVYLADRLSGLLE